MQVASRPINLRTDIIRFTVAKDPRLLWAMLHQSFQRRGIVSPLPGKPTYDFFWSRNALYHGLRALGISSGDNVLVPAFFCATPLEAILQYGAKVKFYNIRRDCSPDFGDLEAKIDQRTRAVLAVHYFGFPGPMRQFQELCKAYHLYLIEDCAHVLIGECAGAALGSFGDISIFSWRKFLPVYDGGHLVINNPRLHVDVPWVKHSLSFSLKVAKNIFDKLLDDSSSKVIKTMSHLLQLPLAMGRPLLLGGQRQLRAITINNRSGDFDISLVNLHMSALSRYIIQGLDIPAIFEKRRSNAIYLLDVIKSLPRISPFFPEIPDGVCPWVFPILAEGQQDFHLALRTRGIPAVTWGDCIHSTLPIEEFPDAEFLYRNLVLLPTHQSLEKSDMQDIIKIMGEVKHN